MLLPVKPESPSGAIISCSRHTTTRAPALPFGSEKKSNLLSPAFVPNAVFDTLHKHLSYSQREIKLIAHPFPMFPSLSISNLPLWC